MGNEIVLRPYQQECVDIINNLDSGSYLVSLFTGAGKTVIFSHIKRQGRTLLLSHREELVYQPKRYFDCSFGVERAEETSHGEEVVSASVQSLVRRLEKFSPDDFDTIITDECFPEWVWVDSRPIKDIKVGDYVSSYNHETGEVEKRKVTYVFKKPMPDKMISFDGGSLVCTPNHPIYCANRLKYVRADEVTKDDILLWHTIGNEGVTYTTHFYGMEVETKHNNTIEYVYNLEVEGNNNYFANGYLVHNCHHAVAPSYRKIYDYFNPRLHLGFTATPNRADKSYLGDIYEKIIFFRDIRWGIENNYLTDIECLKVDIGYDLSDVNVRMGDFANNELAEAVDIRECNEAIAEVYKKYAVGPTLIFASSVQHAENISALIPDSAVITCNTENRGEILQRFTEGRIKCIVNNLILTEGTDLPCVQTIIMCRPTQNISLYTQACGRGLRLYEGKKYLRLIDCVGASSMDICTAPQLFGIDTEIAEKTGQATGLLSDMEQRIEKVQNDWMINRDFWKYNTELIEMFSKGKYDTHNINFTMLGNKDMVCSLGDSKILRITAEDMLGNSSLTITDKNTPIFFKDGIKMQEALDRAYERLVCDYLRNKSLWDRKSVEGWGNAPASDRQKDFLLKLYTKEQLIAMKLNFRNLTKYQASVLINRKISG